MITAVEIGGALLLTGVLATAMVILAAFQLGRLVGRDEDQREFEPIPGGGHAGPVTSCQLSR
jgi:hypothetical protein